MWMWILLIIVINIFGLLYCIAVYSDKIEEDLRDTYDDELTNLIRENKSLKFKLEELEKRLYNDNRR